MLHPPGGESQSDLLQTFIASLRDLRAEPYLLRNEEETVKQLRSLLDSKGCKSPLVAGLPSAVNAVVERALDGREYLRAEELSGPQAITKVASADVGISWMEYGIANQGALMEVVYDDATKLASCLPFHHVAILSSKRILADISRAMPEAGRIISSSRAERMPVISFISGPSRTGDIEMKLLYGVHGPNTLTVLLLEWY